MGLYGTRILPTLIDFAMRGDDIAALRAKTLAPARGRTLEVGFGTGLNARYYGDAVDALVVVDPNAGMSALAEKRLAQAGRTAEHVRVSGEALPLPDRSFDTVVVTFALCSISDAARALQQLRRVVRDDGQLLFCEHNLSDVPSTARWQRRITPWWRPFSGGCHLDRDAPALISANAFVIDDLERTALPDTPAVFGTIRRGRARPG